MTQNGGKKAL